MKCNLKTDFVLMADKDSRHPSQKISMKIVVFI